MSGPIVRKYGFPNFDQIFGKKEMEHGVDETEAPAEVPTPAAEKRPPQEQPKPEAGKK